MKRRSREKTRRELIAAAQHEFAHHGYQGASTTTIAEEAGVSVSMINHHFGGKRALYQACIKGFGEERLARLERYLVEPESLSDFEIRLELLVDDLLLLHLSNLECVMMVLRDINNEELVDADVESTLFTFTLTLARYFQLGIDAGVLRADLDPVSPASIIYLSLSALLQVDQHRQRVSGESLKDPEQRKRVIKNLIDVVLRGTAT